jgi:hypothetical protein
MIGPSLVISNQYDKKTAAMHYIFNTHNESGRSAAQVVRTGTLEYLDEFYKHRSSFQTTSNTHMHVSFVPPSC